MVYYDTARMIIDLNLIIESISNKLEREFITDVFSLTATHITMPQYNRILDLYNKYVVVPASPTQALRNYNY